MAIQLRRGAYGNYDASKLKPAEIGVVQSGDPNTTDGKAVYIAINTNDVKRIPTADEMVDHNAEAEGIYDNIVAQNQTASQLFQNTSIKATEAEQSASSASSSSASANSSMQRAETAADRAETAAATLNVDATLTIPGKPADAKAAMDNILRRTEVMPINPGLSIKSVEGTTVTLTQRSVFYIRNIGASGPAYQNRNAQTEIVLEHNDVLVYNNDTRLLEIVSSSAVLPNKYTTLLWNQMGYLKGLWEPYYLLALFDKYKSDTLQPHFNRQKSSRIMNRQGQGYDYPENSKEGILAAMEDGYRNIRISVSATSDNVIVCNHAYELAHASTSVAFKLDGESYTTDTNINEVTADFISRLTYKGYSIPTLRSVLDDIMKYDTKVTLELKGTYTTESATELLNIIHYYNLDYVISGMANSTQIDVFTAIRQDLNLAVILRYSDNEARSYITKYKNICKSLRLDCYWTDTIPEASLANIIHPDYKIKLGGSEVTSTQVHAALPWCDVCECALKLSEL